VANPLEQFQIKRLAELPLGGLDAAFTNASLFMLVALGLILSFFWLGTRNAALVPNRWQAALEGMTGFITDMVDDTEWQVVNRERIVRRKKKRILPLPARRIDALVANSVRNRRCGPDIRIRRNCNRTHHQVRRRQERHKDGHGIITTIVQFRGALEYDAARIGCDEYIQRSRNTQGNFESSRLSVKTRRC
jgi:hypothetical protein